MQRERGSSAKRRGSAAARGCALRVWQGMGVERGSCCMQSYGRSVHPAVVPECCAWAANCGCFDGDRAHSWNYEPS
eukprot:435950-Prymnesium_polylepis.1